MLTVRHCCLTALVLGLTTVALSACSADADSDVSSREGTQASALPAHCACPIIPQEWLVDPNDPAPSCAPGLCLYGTDAAGAHAWACVDTCRAGICGAEGCNNPDPACKCAAAMTCGVDGKCAACVPKTCADYPGQCSTAAGQDGGASPALSDGCGKTLACGCTGNDICNATGICAPAGCTATNSPKGPQGTSFRPPGLNFEYELPKAYSTSLCGGGKLFGVPLPGDKIKAKIDVAGGWDSKGSPVCVSKDTFDVKLAGEVEVCGWVFGLKGSYNSKTDTLYCPYCDLGDNTNKCKPDFGRQDYASRLRGTAEFGPKWEISVADIVLKLIDKMKYTKKGGGEVNIVKQLPFYSKFDAFVKDNKGSLDDLAKAKAEVKLSYNATRTKDIVQRGTGGCSAALNCDTTAYSMGPGAGFGLSVELNLPPKGVGIGRIVGDVVSFNFEAKVAGNYNYQFGRSTQTGECGSKDCLTVTGFGNVGLIGRVGARFKAPLFGGGAKARASFDMTCVGQVGFQVCDNLDVGPTPPEGKCKVNAFISTE